ncbi:MAG TPA: hypothetical protein VM784_08905 [Actinomycetota bacterium]|nr:hypothetical protein [Actinomycetota bacterium]
MKIEDRTGDPLPEVTVTVDAQEIIDLLQGLADVVEGKREHLHFAQTGGAQLVVRLRHEGDPDPLHRQMDWWLGPLVLFGALFWIIGLITFIRWAAGLLA